MEQNENPNVQEEQLPTEPQGVNEPLQNDADGLSEEEKREILSVFSETNANKARRTGFRLTVRNQLIIVGCVLVAAALLLGTYFLFLKEEPALPDFFKLDAQTVEVLDELDAKTRIVLCNRTEEDAVAETDPALYYVYTYATLYERETSRVKVSFDSKDTYEGVKITMHDQTVNIPYSDFFLWRAIDGEAYAFNGETLLTDTILELSGKDKLELAARPLDGYDADGDGVLQNGRVVVFPMVDRSDIQYLSIQNSHGTYSIYQQDQKFYFADCETLTYDSEKFSSLLVDCRYLLSDGKLENQLALSVYGLDKAENLTCSYTLMSDDDVKGYTLFHQVWIGKKNSAGTYYYAMYFGGRMDADQKVVSTFYNGRVYLIPVDFVEGNILQPREYFFKAGLVTGVEDPNDVLKVSRVEMEYAHYGEESEPLSMRVLNIPVIGNSDNLTSNVDSLEILRDKKTYADSRLKYTDWTGEADGAYLIGFNSNDGEMFSLNASVTNVASDGVYEVQFGLLRDTDNKTYAALMPTSMVVRYSTDGETFRRADVEDIDFSAQAEDTVKQYTVRIKSEVPIVRIELRFELPRTIGYLVMDEIRIMADGIDAVPNDAMTGVWRLVSPSSLVPDGRTYAYMDSNNFTNFLYSLCTLEGDSVVRVGVSKRDEDQGDDIIDMEALAEFGLDEPEMHFAYELNGTRNDVYVSAYDEEAGCYYAYSTVTGDIYGNGKKTLFCNGMIARITTATADWLEWNPLEYLTHALTDIYVYDIEQMEITCNGQTYVFDIKTEGKNITSVRWGDTELNETNFRYMYLSIVQLNMKDAYVPMEGDEPTEYLHVRIKTTSDEKDLMFYRVSSSRVYYTINGSGSYYCLLSSVRNVVNKVELFVSGEEVPR